MKDKTLIIDFETQSEVDLKKAGVYKYVKGMYFRPLCMSYGFADSAEVYLWKYGQPFPFDIVTSNTLAAFNAEFEYQVFKSEHFQNYVGDTSWLKIEDMIDIQAVGNTFGFPQNLDKLAKALNVPHKKDPKGTRLLNLLSVIKAPKYNVPTPKSHPNKFKDLYEYCLQDTRTERDCYNVMIKKSLSDFEQQVYNHTILQNERGLPVDRDAIFILRRTLEEFKDRCNDRLYKLTDGEITAGTQVQRITQYINKRFREVKDITAGTVQYILDNDKLDEHCRKILRLRQLTSKTSTTKFQRMIEMLGEDNRIRGNLKYHGSHTGRFTGVGFQPHNLPRAQHDNPDEVINDFFNLNIVQLEYKYNNIGSAVSKLIRPMVKAPRGKQLVVADYVSIENVLLHWVANDAQTTEDFRNGLDQYKTYAARRFKVEYDDVTDKQRTYAKPCVLGLGYGGGGAALQRVAAGYGITLSDRAAENDKKFYRNLYYMVPNLWYKIHDAMIRAVYNETIVDVFTGTVSLKFIKRGTYAFIILPSGRFLSYPAPLLIKAPGPNHNRYFDDMRWNFTYMGVDNVKRWRRIGDPNNINPLTGEPEMSVHGGRLVENIIQALARDLLVYGGLCAERRGFKMLCSVHDEWIAEVDETVTGNNLVQQFCEAICILPEWAKGLPLRATGYVGKRYRKE